jgi:general secretion pathway protein F
MPKPKPVLLSSKTLAEVYLGLSRLLQTGMPLDKVLTTLIDERKPDLCEAIMQTVKLVQQGKTLADAGRLSGLWRQSDFQLIKAGENSGNLVAVTRRLAEQYSAMAKREGRFRSRMMLPLVVLSIGLVLAPLPSLFGGRIDALGYLLRSGLPLAGVLMTIGYLTHNMQTSRATGSVSILDRMLGLFPAGRKLVADQARTEFLGYLGMYLQAGIDAEGAMKRSIEGMSYAAHRTNVRVAASRLATGSNVSDALLAAGILDDDSDYPVISSGEAAGQLDESIILRAGWHQDDLDQRYDRIAEWSPRLVYTVIAIWFVIGLFT